MTQLIEQSHWAISPKPNHDYRIKILELRLSNYDSRITIVGRLLLTKKIEHLSTLITLDLSAYQNGLYFYQITNEDGVLKTGKLILTK